MDHESCLELAQLCHAIKHKRGASHLQRFLERSPRERVNLRVPDSQFFRDFAPELVGDTLLHLAHRADDSNAYRLLLSFGADFTLPACGDGSTVVHRIAETSAPSHEGLGGRLKNPFLAATLFAHYEYGVRRNPASRRGITHLHAACMANSAEAVMQFLASGADANQTVSLESTRFPGYTPMHFAARYSELCTLETMRILVEHGADVSLEDKHGTTPLDLLIERHARIVEMMRTEDRRDLVKALVASERIVEFLIENCGVEGAGEVFKVRRVSDLRR